VTYVKILSVVLMNYSLSQPEFGPRSRPFAIHPPIHRHKTDSFESRKRDSGGFSADSSRFLLGRPQILQNTRLIPRLTAVSL
jgi:hypothetical protein